MAIVGKGTKEEPIILERLAAEEVPVELRPENFFDFKAHPFEHTPLIDNARSVVDIIRSGGIEKYTQTWLAKHTIPAEHSGDLEQMTEKDFSVGNYKVIREEDIVFKPLFVWGSSKEPHTIYIAQGARIGGAYIFLEKGDIYIGPGVIVEPGATIRGPLFIGEGTVVEPGAGIKGPAIIGRRNEIRQGAYFRGNIIIGDQKKLGDNAIRGELKNVLMLDEANFPHPSYLGDSVCGYNAHMGNGATAANLGIIQGIRNRDERVNLKVKINDKWYDLGRPKMGAVLGDKTQLACETMVDPGTLLGPMCISYGLAYIKSGYYPSGTMFKTRPAVDVQEREFNPQRV